MHNDDKSNSRPSRSHGGRCAVAASGKSAFSMIETVLAVAVLSMGILSIFLLFSSSLDLNTPAVADTRIAIFGDNVLNGLRAESDQAAETTNGWLTFWTDFTNNNTNISAVADWMWSTNDPIIKINGDDTLYTNIYVVEPLRNNATVTGLIEMELRYRLKVELKPSPALNGTTNVAVTLKVWPGVEGSTEDSDALILYTWFYDHGNFVSR